MIASQSLARAITPTVGCPDIDCPSGSSILRRLPTFIFSDSISELTADRMHSIALLTLPEILSYEMSSFDLAWLLHYEFDKNRGCIEHKKRQISSYRDYKIDL